MGSSGTLTVRVNGRTRSVPDGTTVADIVSDVTGHDPDSDQLGVAVALDAVVVPRSEWATTVAGRDADIEIITAMQGG